jgi:hypothetical protein
MDVAKIIDAVPAHVNAQAAITRNGRFCSLEFLLEVGGEEFHLVVERGMLSPVIPGPLKMRPWCFAIRAPLSSWQRFWEPLPPVGFNDIFAMVRHGHARIDGDVGPMLSHLRYVKDVIATPRQLLREQAA